MTLALAPELQQPGPIKAEALAAAAAYNTSGTSFGDRPGFQAELDGSLAVVQEYLRNRAEHLYVALPKVPYPGTRHEALLADFGTAETGGLSIPRRCITAITLNALWGEADCSPVADVRIITGSDRKNPVVIYGKGPVGTVGRWSRFPLEWLVL